MFALARYAETELVSRRFTRERDFESVRTEKRFEDISHDVHRRLFVFLRLLPDDRIIKHVEFVAEELTDQSHRLAKTHYQRLTLGNHRQYSR